MKAFNWYETTPEYQLEHMFVFLDGKPLFPNSSSEVEGKFTGSKKLLNKIEIYPVAGN